MVAEKLDLRELRKGMYGIPSDVGSTYEHASAVCLESQGHLADCTSMSVKGAFLRNYGLSWGQLTEQDRRYWTDEEVTTENGACGIAVLLIEKLTDMSIMERSRKGTGFDYWLGGETKKADLFQKKARLEVSGVRNGDEKKIVARLKKKFRQTDKSDGVYTAIVVIVEFGKPSSFIEEKNERNSAAS